MAARMFTRILLSLALIGRFASAARLTPLMGYNTYNQVGCSPVDAQVRSAINGMSSGGFVAAGYTYFVLDCGYVKKGERAANGSLEPDPVSFPSGLMPLADMVRSKGMQWGMYSDAGVRMCDTISPGPRPGSLGHESIDADYFASFGATYLKYDNCYADGPLAEQNAPKDARTDFVSRYSVMAQELKRVGIPLFAICQWGVPFSTPSGLQGPVQWVKGIANAFRLSDDIAPGFDQVYRIYNQAIHVAKSSFLGPGFNMDADLLEVGNEGMTVTEQITHFVVWAYLKSQLFISTDVTKLSSQLSQVLRNADIIAINQDPLVKPVTLVQRWTGDRDLWVGDLANGDKAVLVVDLSNKARSLTLRLSDLGFRTANIKNLITGETITCTRRYSRTVGAHGSHALRLSHVTTFHRSPKISYLAAGNASLSDGAKILPCSGCSTGYKIGDVGTATFSNIYTSHKVQNVRFDYINGEVAYLGSGASNERVANVSVNGGPSTLISFPLSGYNWDKDVSKDYLVELSGFKTHGPNTITIKGNHYGPDIDRIGTIL